MRYIVDRLRVTHKRLAGVKRVKRITRYFRYYSRLVAYTGSIRARADWVREGSLRSVSGTGVFICSDKGLWRHACYFLRLSRVRARSVLGAGSDRVRCERPSRYTQEERRGHRQQRPSRQRARKHVPRTAGKGAGSGRSDGRQPTRVAPGRPQGVRLRVPPTPRARSVPGAGPEAAATRPDRRTRGRRFLQVVRRGHRSRRERRGVKRAARGNATRRL